VVRSDVDPISARESEVLEGLRDHLTNAEIGQRLHISVRTVESHVSSLLRKLGAADRRDLAARPVVEVEVGPDSELRGIPAMWTTFVGRAADLAAVAKAMAADRLVTLVGPGGIGKTRLAVVAASGAVAGFPGGGAFVDLVPVSSEFVVEAVAAALGVVERAQEPLELAVMERLRAGRSLLVLDNCEHVLGAAAAFASAAMASCPEVVILGTSRARLGVPGERVIQLAPLSLITGDDGVGSEAELLFLDRIATAAGGESDHGVIAEVCQRLEGLPLAIELAAARCDSLGVDGLLTGLGDRLRLLSRSSGAGDRHGSVRSVIEWSYGLLNEEERRLLDRLGVFVGSFSLADAAAVAGDGDVVGTSDSIGRLTDQSLLVHHRGPAGSRWSMLDTIRAFARERLADSAQGDSTRDRHLAWAAVTANDIERAVDLEHDWQDRFDVVIDDLRSALASTTSGAANATTAFELALSLGHLCYARRFLAEGRDHLDAAVARAPDSASAVLALRMGARAAFAEMRGEVAFNLLMAAHGRALAGGDLRTATIALCEASAIGGRCPGLFHIPLTHDQLSAMVEQARAIAPADDLEVTAHLALAAAWDAASGPAMTEPDRAREALRVARELGDPVVLSSALDAAAAALGVNGSFKEASRLTSERIVLLDRLPRHDPRVGGEVADIFHMATESALAAGELHLALIAARRAHEDSTREGLAHFAAADLVIPLALQGSLDEALVQGGVMRDSWERAGQPAAAWMGPAFFAIALIHGLRGDVYAHDEWWQLATTICGITKGNSFGLYVARRVALHRGAIERAGDLSLPEDQEVRGQFGPYVRAIGVEVAVTTGAHDATDRLRASWSLADENDFVAAQLMRAAGILHHSPTELEQAVTQWEAIGARFERACTLLLLRDRAGEGTRELAALGCMPPRHGS
jgi:predicted ATPase/DNA-binding CsgD family transcriptional regulator